MEERETLTPMLAQYHSLKEKYKDCILLFRLGDFYEMFYEDAKIGSKVLGIALTSRPAGKGRERIPMCGVPYHSVQSYLQRLVMKGYKVALCEQLEEASKGKKIVRREVVRVITPGTYFERSSEGLLSLIRKGKRFFLAYVNLSTGDFWTFSCKEDELLGELSKYNFKEILTLKGTEVPEEVSKLFEFYLTELDWEFLREGLERIKGEKGIVSPRVLGVEEEEYLMALALAYNYVKRTQKDFLPFLRKPKVFRGKFMRIDYRAQRSLELVKNQEGRENYTLLWAINRTLTPMGKRLLKIKILNPLLDLREIEKVKSSVKELLRRRDLRLELERVLKEMPDLDRLISRISSNISTPRDFILLKNSLKGIKKVGKILKNLSSERFRELLNSLEEVGDLIEVIEKVLVEEPPIHLKEGGLVKEGTHKELDLMRERIRELEGKIKEYEEELRRETGILSLKISYNKVMGYFIEVTKPNLKLVPKYFKRRQTLSSSERFTTDYLKSLEEEITTLRERSNHLEYELFCNLRERVLEGLERVAKNSLVLAELDFLLGMSKVVEEKNWCEVEFTEGIDTLIEEGRNPIMEETIRDFVPNDTRFSEEERVLIITGPNMAGKSSYIRQVALIFLLAQMCGFAPARKVRLGVADALLTRIGSGDYLPLGISTFLNEMLDVSNVINNATKKSLVILDEIGRGTSTYDGISIAKAVLEYLGERVGCRVLCATHFLELTELGKKRGFKNYHMGVERDGGGVRFLYRLVEGVGRESFGIEVAKMAGIPQEVVKKAEEHLRRLREGNTIRVLEEAYQRSGEDEEIKEVLRELLSLQIERMTPLEALIYLAKLKEKVLGLKTKL